MENVTIGKEEEGRERRRERRRKNGKGEEDSLRFGVSFCDAENEAQAF